MNPPLHSPTFTLVLFPHFYPLTLQVLDACLFFFSSLTSCFTFSFHHSLPFLCPSPSNSLTPHTYFALLTTHSQNVFYSSSTYVFALTVVLLHSCIIFPLSPSAFFFYCVHKSSLFLFNFLWVFYQLVVREPSYQS